MADLADVMLQTKAVLDANLPLGISVDQIEYPNIKFDQPDNAPWMRVTWANAGVTSTDASHCYEINQGIMVIDFFYPKYSSVIQPVRNAEFVKKAMLGATYDDVTLSTADVVPIGETGVWYMVQLNINYQYEGYVNV